MSSSFHVTRPVGAGHSRPNDVIRIRRALTETGHGRSPREPSGVFDPSVQQTIKRFQRDYGLKPDAVIKPRGPTERAINSALDAKRADKRHEREAAEGRGEFETAMMPDRVLRGNRFDQTHILEGGGGGGAAAGGVAAGALLGEAIRRLFSNDNAKPKPDQPPPGRKPAPSERTVPAANLPKGPAPFPAEPPPELKPDKEEFLPVERGPTLMISPIPEQEKPAIEVFPDMSDMLEQWLVVESRGKPDGQQKDVQYVIDRFFGKSQERGFPLRHTAGGKRVIKDEGGDIGSDRKERFIHRTEGKVKGGRRSDIAFVLDGKEKSDEEILDINVVDTLVDGETPTKREREAFEAIVELKKQWGTRGDTVALPKSKRMTWEEFTAGIDKWVDEYFDALEARLKSSGRLAR